MIAVGGGSVMDCSKMIALAAVDALDEDAFWDKYFVRFEPITCNPLPLGIVVTAMGTGSEGNGGGVITTWSGACRRGLRLLSARLRRERGLSFPVWPLRH